MCGGGRGLEFGWIASASVIWVITVRSGEGVQELRIDCGPGYRVYFGIEEKCVILLLLGGDKSSQSRDIATSKEHWRAHQGRAAHD